MGCGSTRVGVVPQVAHGQSEQPLNCRQTKGSSSKVAWSNKLARNSNTSLVQLSQVNDAGGSPIVSERTASPTDCSSNTARTVVSTNSLPESVHTVQQEDGESEMGERLSMSPCEGQLHAHESGYQSANRSVEQEERVDVAASNSPSGGASIKQKSVSISRVNSEGHEVLISSRESVRQAISPPRDPLYLRLARLTATLDGHICGTVAHSEGTEDSKIQGLKHSETEQVSLGRSRSIRSLRVYHGRHSESEAIGRKVSVAKAVVKALVTRTLSNFGSASTSLDWESMADALGIGNNQLQAGDEPSIGNSKPYRCSVSRSSLASEYLGDELWENSKCPHFEESISESHSVVNLSCKVKDEVLTDQSVMLSQAQDRNVNRLSPAVSRKVSSNSRVSRVHSRSQLEDFVERVSSALMTSNDNGRSSAVHMLVLQPSLAGGTAVETMSDESNFDTMKRSELQTTEIGESEDMLSVHELYNLLNAGIVNPYIYDPYYILMLDARSQPEYEISHVITANWHNSVTMDMRFLIDPVSFLDRYSLVVVYDDKSSSVSETESAGPQLLQRLEKLGIEHVSLLSGGFRAVQEQYPFLCDTKVYWSEDDRLSIQTFPSAVIPGKLYQGNGTHAASELAFKHLGITHVVNITEEHPNWFEDNVEYMKIYVADERESHLYDSLPQVTEFIKSALANNGTVLVHCNQGVSRSSTVTLAFLIERYKWTLETSYEFLKDRRPGIRPNRGFLDQLSMWEVSIHGKCRTDIDDLW